MRLPADAKEKIEQAATLSGLTLTDFAIHSLVRSADEVLERHRVRMLSDRDRDRFLALLDGDHEPNDALRTAAEAYRQKVVS
jgi:uncharacterized protein (DUF1778 family)